jgi:flagellar assembly protein FliH
MIDATVQLGLPIASVRTIEPPHGSAAQQGTSAAAAPATPADAGAAAAIDQAGKALQAQRAELTSARAALLGGIKQIADLRDSVIKAAEQQIVQLAIDVARKVLMQEVQAGRYEIDPIVQAALAQVTNWQDLVVHLNPDDFTRCQQAQEPAQDDLPGVRFVADPAVKRSECLLETAQGVVRSANEEHLSEIASALLETE